MTSSQNRANLSHTHHKPPPFSPNLIIDPTIQFTDKTICTQTQTNLTPSKNNKSGVQIGPKQKLSQIVYNLKSSDFFTKYEQEKKESLKKEWINMKKSHQKLLQNQDQQQNATNNLQFVRKNIKSRRKLKQFDVQTPQLIEKNYSRPVLQQSQFKKSQKRKRSKTQMLIYDYEHEKIGTLELAHHLQQECYSSQNAIKKNQPKQKTIHIEKRNKTVSVNPVDCIFVKSETKPKSYLEQVRQATHINFTSGQESLPKRKSSLQTQQHFQKDEEIEKHCLSRPKNPISKSVMVQKIINLRKTFNDKYKKSPKKSLIESSIVQSSFSQNKQVPPPPTDSNTSLIIPYMSFPVMDQKATRKLTFQELFQHEKKKMQLLKKYVNKGGVFNSFVQEKKHQKEGESDFQENNDSHLMNLSQLSNSKSLFMDDSSEYLNYLNQSKNFKRPKAKWSQLEQQEIKTIKSKSKVSPQHILNISSIPIIQPNNSLQKDLLESSAQEKQSQTPQRRVTTYDFEYMNRHLQRPEVKELRHKYLYSSKRKFSKQECSQYGIAMISVHQGDETTLRKWKIKCKTESMMEECLEIEKKIPQNWDRMGKTSTNFIKTTYERKKAASLGKQVHLASKQFNKNTQNFEPWQNHIQHQFDEGQEIGEFPD